MKNYLFPLYSIVIGILFILVTSSYIFATYIIDFSEIQQYFFFFLNPFFISGTIIILMGINEFVNSDKEKEIKKNSIFFLFTAFLVILGSFLLSMDYLSDLSLFISNSTSIFLILILPIFSLYVISILRTENYKSSDFLISLTFGFFFFIVFSLGVLETRKIELSLYAFGNLKTFYLISLWSFGISSIFLIIFGIREFMFRKEKSSNKYHLKLTNNILKMSLIFSILGIIFPIYYFLVGGVFTFLGEMNKINYKTMPWGNGNWFWAFYFDFLSVILFPYILIILTSLKTFSFSLTPNLGIKNLKFPNIRSTPSKNEGQSKIDIKELQIESKEKERIEKFQHILRTYKQIPLKRLTSLLKLKNSLELEDWLINNRLDGYLINNEIFEVTSQEILTASIDQLIKTYEEDAATNKM